MIAAIEAGEFKGVTCPVDLCIEFIKGKRKAAILLQIAGGCNRYSELKKEIKIHKRVLARQLRELQEDKLITKTTIREKPLHIEYSLTDLGLKLSVLIKDMFRWSMDYCEAITKE
ncbi:winged helix-turn-helix transcriptional regulator [Sediminibacterium ginsengisoli]|uniref:DNA-binding transcriptional regulator, HxlR family n=1 Tax=Sediminibacterium ginsengisoli TaxID=413434 RepID=A0A1T4M912_9BACT|nr:helix-turn-helix domain-containing protein [Sediminibacterium ginsengisoli]SJZ63278.1 DNA-binding transcriptional regulator, HxlR family [Sediminibacterium ginsengisoli]